MSPLRNTLRSLSRARLVHHVLPGAAALLIAGLAVGCADGPTGPAPAAQSSVAQAPAAPSRGLLSTVTSTLGSTVTSTLGVTVNGLLWTKAATQTSVSRVIGPEGGSLSIPNGIRVTVPRGAVASNVTFSVTRRPGLIVAYDFQPHGTRFAVPVQIEQPTLGTNLFKLAPLTALQGAYYEDASLLDQLAGTATVTEFRPTFVSADRAWVTFTVDHFSGYLVAWGRR